MKKLADFKDIHKGKKIVVCASGESMINISINDYRKLLLDEEIILIGASWVGKYIKTKYLLCVDAQKYFIDDSFKYIKNNHSDYVFTCVNDLDVEENKKVKFILGNINGTNIDSINIDHTNNSVYMCCLLAYYMGASKIGMIGNDFTNGHVLSNWLPYLDVTYKNLLDKFNKENIGFYNLSEVSLIKTIPFQYLEKF